MMLAILFMSLLALLSMSNSDAVDRKLRFFSPGNRSVALVADPPPSWIGSCLNREVCQAKEVTLKYITAFSNVTSCAEGSKVNVSVTATFSFSAARYDFGVFLGLDGSVDSGSTCAIAPLLREYRSSYTTSHFSFVNWNLDGDVCGDMIFYSIFNFPKSLTMEKIFSDNEIECKAGANGKLLLPLCYSWKQQGENTKCTVNDLTAGTTAKCGCSDVSVDSVSVTQPVSEDDEKDQDEQDQDKLDQDEQDQDELDQDELDQDGKNQDELDQDELDQDELDQDELDQDELDQDELDQDELDQDGLDQDGLDQDGLDQYELDQYEHDQDRQDQGEQDQGEQDQEEQDQEEQDQEEQDQEEQDQEEQNQDEQDQDEQDQDEQDQDEQDQDELDQDELDQDDLDQDERDQDEQDRDEQDQDEQDQDEQDDEDDCEDSETEKTINVGGNSALRSATKTSSTKRILLPDDATIGFDYVTKPAFDAYKVSSWFEFARSKASFSYFFEDAAFLNSCYDYDIILGFAELETKYCTGIADEPNRIMKVLVNAGEGDVFVRPGFNVVDKTGGECFQAYMIKYTVQPTSATIGITVERTEESNSDAILSFIKIKRSAQRRLEADCNKEIVE